MFSFGESENGEHVAGNVSAKCLLKLCLRCGTRWLSVERPLDVLAVCEIMAESAGVKPGGRQPSMVAGGICEGR